MSFNYTEAKAKSQVGNEEWLENKTKKITVQRTEKTRFLNDAETGKAYFSMGKKAAQTDLLNRIYREKIKPYEEPPAAWGERWKVLLAEQWGQREDVL